MAEARSKRSRVTASRTSSIALYESVRTLSLPKLLSGCQLFTVASATAVRVTVVLDVVDTGLLFGSESNMRSGSVWVVMRWVYQVSSSVPPVPALTAPIEIKIIADVSSADRTCLLFIVFHTLPVICCQPQPAGSSSHRARLPARHDRRQQQDRICRLLQGGARSPRPRWSRHHRH